MIAPSPVKSSMIENGSHLNLNIIPEVSSKIKEKRVSAIREV